VYLLWFVKTNDGDQLLITLGQNQLDGVRISVSPIAPLDPWMRALFRRFRMH